MNQRAVRENAPKRSVLVVEDNDDLRHLIVKRLRRAGFDAQAAALAGEAVDKAAAMRYAVLLIDHNLPDMSGQALIDLLKERGATHPFIVMTGQGDEQLAVRMMKQGAADYLVKDSELVEKLPDVLGRLFSELETERRILEDRSILLDNIQTQVWYLTDDHTYGAVNKAHAAFNGLGQEEMAFRDMYSLFPKEIVEKRRENAMKVFSSGESLTTEEWLPSGSGERRLLSILKSPKLRDDGSVEYVVCSAEDNTERKRAEDALRESEERFRKLFSNVWSVAVQGYSPDGTVQYWNRASEQLYGYSPEEAIGRNILDLIIPPEIKEAVKADIFAMTAKGEGRAAEKLVLRKKDGSMVDVFSSHVVVGYSDGRQELFCLDVDISDIKRMEESLRAAKENAEWLGRQANAASRAKSAFLANTSHELRTPLNGAIGFLELLSDTQLDEQQREYVGYIRTSAYSLLEVVSAVLDISKIESEKFDLKLVRSDIHEMVRQALDAVRGNALQKQLRLVLDIEDGVPRYAVVDPARLKQVLVNLLGNAVKFTEAGSVELSLRWRPAGAEKCAYTFSVRDTGIGIAPKERRRLFEPFYQADASNTRKYGGVGLGLSICEALLKKMDAFLELESAPGQGSRFFFTLRAACGSRAEETPSRSGEEQENGEQRFPRPIQTVKPPVILIVEDQRLNRRLIKVLLSKIVPGSRILEATNGEEAVELFRRKAPSLVLMDLQMPVKDGCEVAAEMRVIERENAKNEKSFARTAIIAVIADVQPETREFCLKNGMDDYIAKPVDTHALRNLLDLHLNGRA